MATLKQISKIVGIAPATVSRILNNDTTLSVKDETRMKVLEVAEQLEYKTKVKNKDIRTMCFDIVFSYKESSELVDPYYLSIRMALEKECKSLDIQFNKIYKFQEDMVFSGDGILAIGNFTSSQRKLLFMRCKHLIFIDHDTFPEYDCIVPDLSLISKTVLEYFIKKNYKKIGFIGGRDLCDIPDEREIAFMEYTKLLNIFDSEYFYVGEFTNESGYIMATQMLSKSTLPEAIFIANDSLAIGVLKALNEHKIIIPKQVAIISINDIPAAHFTFPALTTMRIESEFMGTQAVRILKDKIISNRIHPMKILVPYSLIYRDTTPNHQ